jgi:hypothetical protein
MYKNKILRVVLFFFSFVFILFGYAVICSAEAPGASDFQNQLDGSGMNVKDEIKNAVKEQNSIKAGIQEQLGAAAGQQGANFGAKQDPRTITARIIRTALGILGTIFLILVLYAGFLWMTAAGNEDSITKAKKLLYQGVVGLAIILSAYGITLLVFRLVQGQPPDKNYIIDNPANWCSGSNCPSMPVFQCYEDGTCTQ